MSFTTIGASVFESSMTLRDCDSLTEDYRNLLVTFPFQNSIDPLLDSNSICLGHKLSLADHTLLSDSVSMTH